MKKIIAIFIGVAGFIVLDILSTGHPLFLIIYLLLWMVIGAISLMYRFATKRISLN